MAARQSTMSSLAPPALLGALILVTGLLAGKEPKLAIAMSIGVVFVAVVLSNLTVGLVLFTFLSFLEVLPLGASPQVSAIKLAGLLLALSWLAVMANRGSEEIRDLVRSYPRLALALLVFLGWVTLSITWAVSPGGAQLAALRLLLDFTLFFIAFTALRKEEHFVWVIWAFVMGAVASALYGMLVPQAWSVAGRLSGAGTNANDLAAVLVAGLVLAGVLVYYYRRSPLARTAALIALGFCGAGVVLTLSRAGLLALGVMLVCNLLIASRGRGATLFVSLLVAISVVGYFGLVASPDARERVTTVGSGTGRTDLWKVGGRMIEANPVVGVGAASFGPASVKYVLRPGVVDTQQLATYSAAPTIAHNIYLETLAELGVIGLLLFIPVLGIPLLTTYRAARIFWARGDPRMELLARGVFVAQVGLLTTAFFASTQYSKNLWLLLALGPALEALARSRPLPGEPG
jgi:O-antigen ligase